MKLKYIIIPFVTIVTLIGLYMLYRNVSYLYGEKVVEPIVVEPTKAFDVIVDRPVVESDVPFVLKTNIDEEGTYEVKYDCKDEIALKQNGKTLLCDVKQPLDVKNRNIEDLVIVSRKSKLKTVGLRIFYTENATKKKANKMLNVTVKNNNIQEEE